MSRTPDLMKGCARLPGEALNSEGYRGLVGRWAPINQGPGGLLLYDRSRRGPPGALTNMVVGAWESSHLGPVLDFVNANSGVVVPSRLNLTPLEVSVRVVFRTQPGAFGGVVYVLRKGGVLIDYYCLITAAGILSIAFNDGALRAHNTGAGVMVPATWYDLTFSFGNGRARLWLNGALLIDAAEANVMPQTVDNLVLGSNQAAAGSFLGKLALVEIWDYCLPKPISLDPHFLAYAE